MTTGICRNARSRLISASAHGQLREYQKTGVSWLLSLRNHGLGACLADDMGLGKGIQIIALLLLLHERNKEVKRETKGPTLLVCPTSVVGNWRHELMRFAPSLRVPVHHGTERNRDRETFSEDARRHDVIVSTYALLYRDETSLLGVDWDAVVLDEAQNIKNPSTKGAQSARKLRAHWRAALTGTPVENRLQELWSIFNFLNPGYLGSAEEFRKEFANPIERAGSSITADKLKSVVAPFILRRVKTDRSIISDLPEKNEMKLYCTLTREQATLYQAVLKDGLSQIEEAAGIGRRGEILAMLTKLKQVCNHPALFLHDGSTVEGRSGKLARLCEMLEEALSVGDRALVFTQYAQMGKMLKEHLESLFGREVLFLRGGTRLSERDRMVTRFQGDDGGMRGTRGTSGIRGGPPIFILSLTTVLTLLLSDATI
jgi:SNF2 family DNA or RNA helicase